MPSESETAHFPDSGLLPTAPAPQGSYLPAVCNGGLVFTAGMTPRVEGVLQHAGQVGDDVSIGDARAAAGIAVSNAVAAVAERLGSTQRIERVLRMTVYVSAARGFTEHSQVADGASDRLAELLGNRGAAVRSAVGVSSLPGGACVEVELICSRA